MSAPWWRRRRGWLADFLHADIVYEPTMGLCVTRIRKLNTGEGARCSKGVFMLSPGGVGFSSTVFCNSVFNLTIPAKVNFILSWAKAWPWGGIKDNGIVSTGFSRQVLVN